MRSKSWTLLMAFLSVALLVTASLAQGNQGYQVDPYYGSVSNELTTSSHLEMTSRDRDSHVELLRVPRPLGENDISQVGNWVPGSIRTLEGDDLQRSIHTNGRFHNPWPSWNEDSFKIINIVKLGMNRDNTSLPRKEELERVLPILKPDFTQPSPLDGVRITWIGHSTIVVQIDGITILTDPIFSSRASPSQFFGPKRYRRPACTIKELPESLDVVLISHDHYDHLDAGSVTALNSRYGDRLLWLVPLNLTSWFHRMDVKNVVELDWWQEYQSDKGIKFVFTPAQHWSKRGVMDDFLSLWGSWTVIGPRNRFFFTGDTGYCPIFKKIGEKFGPFTAAAIPIGAYAPRWFMGPQHVDPQQAVQLHKELRSRASMAIHWGTFALAFEYFLGPVNELNQALAENNIPQHEFVAMKHGESRILPYTDFTDSPELDTKNSLGLNIQNFSASVPEVQEKVDQGNLMVIFSMINRIFRN